MFVWLTIHGIKDTSTLFQLGLDNGVAFLPGIIVTEVEQQLAECSTLSIFPAL